MKIFNQTRVLEEIESPSNGTLRVVDSIAWGRYIQAGDNPGKVTQSGGVLTMVWKKTLKKLMREKSVVGKCLILGIGGGSAAMLVSRFWKEVKITGVDIDPKIVYLGKKYLGLDTVEDIEIIINDAFVYCAQAQKDENKFDLILIDIYQGDKVPEKFETEEFFHNIKGMLGVNGISVFNKLYVEKNDGQSKQIEKILQTVFANYREFKVEANVMYICGDGNNE